MCQDYSRFFAADLNVTSRSGSGSAKLAWQFQPFAGVPDAR
jgi:hypothetical protein